jgi:hypothetical protein
MCDEFLTDERKLGSVSFVYKMCLCLWVWENELNISLALNLSNNMSEVGSPRITQIRIVTTISVI